MSDEPQLDLCECTRFELWYEELCVVVCRCGHLRRTHLDGHGTCIGEVEHK
jgi:hypothetical protein